MKALLCLLLLALPTLCLVACRASNEASASTAVASLPEVRYYVIADT